MEMLPTVQSLGGRACRLGDISRTGTLALRRSRENNPARSPPAYSVVTGPPSGSASRKGGTLVESSFMSACPVMTSRTGELHAFRAVPRNRPSFSLISRIWHTIASSKVRLRRPANITGCAQRFRTGRPPLPSTTMLPV